MLVVFNINGLRTLCYATGPVAKKGPERDFNSDLCDARAVLHKLSYQSIWSLSIHYVWAYHRPTRTIINEISFELRMDININIK